MNFSLGTVMLIASIVIFSVFVVNLANLINADDVATPNANRDSNGWAKDKQQLSENFVMDDKPTHLMWFLQISDLHISVFSDNSREHDLRDFATRTLDAIKPVVVVASGDLTDAKDRDHLGSRQYENEWQTYHKVLQETNVRNRTIWMDIRGNHDNFNVASDDAPENYYRKYSVQGNEHKRSYMHQVRGNGGELYTFIAVDACLNPGPKRPFNFIGILTKNDTTSIDHLMQKTKESGGHYTVWFGHYPTSCVITMDAGDWDLRRAIGKNDDGMVYLCGHLHTLGGMVPHMYSLQKSGYLELELADWKTTRTYRLAAFDHGLFSFTDVKHDSWPVILVTNPKHAMFRIPHKEDPDVTLKSTHIRVLGFSPDGIANCTIALDHGAPINCTRVNDNLFVVKWDPTVYKSGSHVVTARMTDGVGREKEVSQPFILDGSDGPPFALLARFAVMGDISAIFIGLFAVALAIYLVPLIFFRIWHYAALANRVRAPRIPCRGTVMPLTQKLWVLSSVDRLFWPILCYGLYLAVGPWSIGEVIDGHMGIVFLWGIFVNGSFLPGSLTYLHGFLQLLLCQVPLLFIYSNCIEVRYYQFIGVRAENHRVPWCSWRKLSNAAFFLIITVEIILAVVFWNSYGILAFLIGPFRTWSVVLNGALWYLARNVPNHCLRSASCIWNPKEQLSDSTEHVDSSQL